LVLDGNSPLNPEHLAIASVDCVSSHYYPPSAQQLAAAAAAAAAAGKVFLAGEYGWSGGMNASAATATCEAAGAACSGTAVWSLFPHRDDSGWVAHSDGFTLHYPGLESSSAAAEFQALQAHGAAMAGAPQPPLPPPLQPLLQAASTGALAWRGAALAVGYVVQAGAGAGGPWRTVSPPVGSPGAPSDATGTWAVPGGLLQAGQWVRMGALGAQGEAGAWSEPMQVEAAVE
jgi:mannan endo-1,4-beta-mannosidase